MTISIEDCCDLADFARHGTQVADDLLTPVLVGILAPLPRHWIVRQGDQAVGLISQKTAPGVEPLEIGYGVAPSAEGRGIATAGVGLVVRQLAAEGVRSLCAETVESNIGSIRVLERNGFVRAGLRDDAEDGPLILWHRGG